MFINRKNLFKKIKTWLSAIVNGVVESRYFSESKIFKTNHKYIRSIVKLFLLGLILLYPVVGSSRGIYSIISAFISAIVLLSVIYFLVYDYVKIPKNLISFICFAINIIILIAFFRGFYLLYLGFETPISVDTLPLLSRYRYVIFCLLSLLVLILYLTGLRYPTLSKSFTFFAFPHLKEEVRLLLKALFDYNLGTMCIWLTYILIKSKYFKYIYFGSHFLLFYIYRFLMLLIFIKFCFFHGDLSLIFYCLPLSFIIWLLGFIFYYHSWVIDGNFNYLKACLKVTINFTEIIKEEAMYIRVMPDACNFTITALGYAEGFSKDHYPQLIQAWLDFTALNMLFSLYNKYTSFISKSLLSIYFCCWLYLCYFYFFNQSVINQFNWGIFGHISRRFYHTTTPLHHWDARHIKEYVMNPLRTAVYPNYSSGHLLVGELQADGSFRAYGYLTSKPNTIDPDVKPELLCGDTKVNNVKGQQYFVRFLKSIDIKKGDFDMQPYGISSTLLQRTDISSILEEIKKNLSSF